ncbi:hypothetical protein V3C99_007875 [Haemonchus contortus]
MYRTATGECTGEVKREDPHKVSAEVRQCIARAALANDVVLINVPADNIKRLLIGNRLYNARQITALFVRWEGVEMAHSEGRFRNSSMKLDGLSTM